MIGALIILAVTAAVGVLLWAWEHWRQPRHGASLHHHAPATQTSSSEDGGRSVVHPQGAQVSPSVCCGLHAICEKTGQINEPPVYYDDEELDRFAGKSAHEYTDSEIEEFRDIILTLLPSDAPGWAISLEKRRIALPSELQPELELLLSEA